jgi:Domain of unknown function (DUF1844)
MSEQKPGFTVTDRRSFTGDTAKAEGQPEQTEQPQEPTQASAAEAERAADRAAERQREGRGMPPVDFTTFVLSLGSSAVLHLGEAEHPQTGKIEKDLPMAKHTIDLLSMLQEKTKGNLTAQEAKLLESLLYDLRLRYVEAARK